MLIRELEEKTGLERATIRFYEKEGFITPTRQENGYRTYSQQDSETLLKVKLLRQLGMPLDRIRSLQQGSEDFTTVLTEQVNKLEHQMQDAERAKEVCVELRDAGVTYKSLDAAHYLHELTRARPAEPAWTPQPVPEFKRRAPTHPWRRYFARMIDYSLLNMAELFLLVVVLRIRSMNNFVYTLVGFAIFSHLLWIPIEGLFLHYWGTTPGKWIMGIRVESENGEKLTVSAAMSRAWAVLRQGFGFTIPIYGIWRLYRSYKDYVDSGYAPWDWEWKEEFQFQYYYKNSKKVAIGALAAVYLLLGLVTLNDSVLPKHRGEDLTVAQIAENNNDFMEQAYGGSSVPRFSLLKENGQFVRTYLDNSFVFGAKALDGYHDYLYEVENGFVRSITFEQSWTEVAFLAPMGGSTIPSLIMSIATAQEWMTLPRAYDFADILERASEHEEGCLLYENLEIHWLLEQENCVFSDGAYYSKDNTADSRVHFRFELIIHKT